MTQPDYVPLAPGTRLRDFDELENPGSWTANRPSELAPLKGSAAKQGKFLGTPGPDSGFALKLTRIALDEIELSASEDHSDIMKVISAVAIKRAALFSRAPVIHDVRFALKLFGFGNADNTPDDLVKFRKEIMAGSGHNYFKVRKTLELISLETLNLTAAELNLSRWREYFLFD